MAASCGRRAFLGGLGVGGLGLLVGGMAGTRGTQGAPAGGRPKNIILILADDLGWADTSFTGSSFFRTPNVERLARRGVYFPNAYSASPLCSPTRASIMTGQSPARTGFTAPAGHLPQEILKAGVQERAPASRRQLECNSITRLSTEYHTLAKALKDAGYATGHFGKWHLGKEPYSPLEHGFDVDIPHWPGPGPAGSFVAPWRYPNFKERTPGEHIEDRMADEAVAFMEANRDRPFYLNYWQFSVHAPFDAKQELIAAYRGRLDPDNPQRSPTYAAMVHSLDDSIGTLLDAVDRLGLTDDTVIVFYSDNGGNMYDDVDGTTATSNAPLRGGKATVYEGGVRVPAIISWPGVTQGGTRNEALVQSEDLYPTIIEMAGARPRPEQPCDGRSMVPAMRGDKPLRETVFCYFPHAPRVPDWTPASVMARRGDWKLIRSFHDGADQQHRHELYNLREDTGEQRNLAAARPDLVRDLGAEIDRFLQDTGAVVPRPNPAFSPDAAETVGGWQTRAADHASIDFNGRLKALQFRAFAAGAAMRTVEPLDLPAGDYTVTLRMLALAQGEGRVRYRAGAPDAAVIAEGTIPVRHDRHWHDYQVPLRLDRPGASLDLLPCGDSGTLQIRRIQLLAADGKAVREWAFDTPPARAPQGAPPAPVGGWTVGANGHAAATLGNGCLNLVVTGGDAMLMSAAPLGQGAGTYVFRLRMKSSAAGGGLVFGRPESRGYLPGTGKDFDVHHDGAWHEYRVELPLDHALHELRLDPCAGRGGQSIDWIRLETAAGQLVREWTFDE